MLHFQITLYYQVQRVDKIRPKTTSTLPCFSYSTGRHICMYTISIGVSSGNVGLKPQSDIDSGSYIYIDIRFLNKNDDITTW